MGVKYTCDRCGKEIEYGAHKMGRYGHVRIKYPDHTKAITSCGFGLLVEPTEFINTSYMDICNDCVRDFMKFMGGSYEQDYEERNVREMPVKEDSN